MITTDPEHNSPTTCICAKCGRSFIRGTWSGVFRADESTHYRFADADYPLVTLCDKCALEELSADRVSELLFCGTSQQLVDYYQQPRTIMNIGCLCAAVKSSLTHLAIARTDSVLDHSLVEAFQKSIKDNLNASNNGYKWGVEETAKGRSERDSIDILGTPTTALKSGLKWIIEIDATRSDQVSQKFLSRLALWGLKEPMRYVAILYPDTQNGKKACEKYLRYGNAILRTINKASSVVGIFVDPSANSIEVFQFSESNHFDVNGKECKSMNEAAAEAIRVYLSKHPVKYAELKKFFGRYVLDQRGASRYKNTNVKTSDDVTVYSYTQFRQYGLSSYWTDFERLCKKKGIVITKMRKLYTESPLYTYEL